MAYTQKSKIFGDAENDGTLATAGGLPTSTPAPMATAGGGTPATKQAPVAPAANQPTTMGPGTGFVNMDRLLGANAGIGNKVAQTGNTALANERKNLTGEVGKFDKAVSEGSSMIGNDLTSNIDKLFGGGATDDDKNAIMGGLGATYTGPTAFNYKATGSLNEANALGSGKSAGKQLATNAGTAIEGGLAGYNPNVSALDRALYGTEASAVKATGDVARGTKNLKADIKTYSGNANQRADNAAKDVAGYRQGILDRLLGGAQGTINNAQALADEAGAKEAADKAGGVLRDPVTGEPMRLNAAGNIVGVNPETGKSYATVNSRGDWQDGTSGGPTAGNFIGNNADTLDWIAKALGDSSLAVQNTGPYQAGSYQEKVGKPGTGVAGTPGVQRTHANSPSIMGINVGDFVANAENMARDGAEESRLKQQDHADMGTIFGSIFGGPLGLLGLLNRPADTRPKPREKTTYGG